MSYFRFPRSLLICASSLIVLVNSVILAGVAYNRGAESTRVQLDQREMALPSSWRYNEEDSGLHLLLRWRVEQANAEPYTYTYNRQANWLDADKLRELGYSEKAIRFDPAAPFRGWASSKRRWLVLEFDGDSRQRALTRARSEWEQARAALDDNPTDTSLQQQAQGAERRWISERDEQSRLFAIDAGRNPAALRAMYPDSSRYLIARGRIQPGWIRPTREQPTAVVAGRIQALDIETLHVPLQFRHHFERHLQGRSQQRDDQHRVIVAWGRRYEPWLVAVEPDPG